MSKQRLELSGMKFGKLSVVEIVYPLSRRTKFLCLCDCGNKTIATGSDIKSGNTTSCGCVKRENGKTVNLIHGASAKNARTGAYRSWQTMKSRCYNEDNNRFYLYGARGITVCDRWLDSFENFFADMGERPDGCSLDRIDVNGNYDPHNCRWSTSEQQSRNQRTNVWYLLGNKKMIQADVAKAIGIHPSTLLQMRRKNALPKYLTALTA